MPEGYRIAVVGATGAVGIEMIRVLEARDFPVSSLRLLASQRSVGKKLKFRGQEVAVEVLGEDSFRGIDVALFSAGGSISKALGPVAARSGAVVVDNSSAFRLEPDVPLVVPEINPKAVESHNGIIANPNCSTIIMVVVLWPIHRLSPLESVVVSTYQAVSGAGAKGMDALEREVETGEADDSSIFPHAIAYNLVPRIDIVQDNDYTREEMKMLWETRKIMSLPDLPVSATCVRVPVRRAHSEALHVTTRDPLTAERVRQALQEAPGIKVVDDPRQDRYPMPLDASGKDEVYAGRIRTIDGFPRTVSLWISGDQLLKGAALNSVQIAELVTGRTACAT